MACSAFDNYFLQAQRIRERVSADFNSIFRVGNALQGGSVTNSTSDNAVDVIIHPSAIRTAPPLPSHSSSTGDDTTIAPEAGLDTYVQDVMTVPASLAGLPALSIPACSGADGWPLGVSVVGQWGCDNLVMKVGQAIERLHTNA